LIGLIVGIIAYIGSILRKQSSILQAKMADITSIIHETVTGIKIVKAFGMEKFEEDRFKRETEKFFRTILKMVRVRNAASPLTEFLTVGVGTAIIYYGGELVLVDKSLSASEFMGFLFAIFQIIQPIKELSSVNNRIQESSAAADRVFEIIDIEPDIRDSEDSVEKTNFEDSIRLEHVWFKYDDGDDYVLKDINLEVKKGEIVAVVGSSGGGKTTLVDLIPRFFDVTKGSILLDEVNIKNIKISSIKQLIGVVTQETILFNDSVRNNIAYGLTDIPDEKIIEVAKAANAHKFIMELPEGLDTVIGERGVRLSGGQRQRISIARALLKNPPIMILDEATSSLDNESEVLVQAAIERLMEERTVIVIAHRLSTIRNSSKIIVLDGGEIVQSGTHDELVADEQSIYKMLYDLQFRIDSESDE
jgi:subfamily B ATP-binding cassette protein MsbA